MEIHRSVWAASDFEAVSRSVTTTTQDDVLLAVLLKDGVDVAVPEAAAHKSGPSVA
jgi:hypothetical protein